jgi:predicted metal-binding membrane protein
MERLAPRPFARERNLILAILLGLAGAGWAVLVVQAGRDDMGMHDMAAAGPDLTMGRSAPLFFAMWLAMMVAMMFPAAAPMITMYARTQHSKGNGATALFVASYLILWVIFGVVAFALGALIETLAERSAWVADNWARVGGILLLLAGLYQLSPLKRVCLTKCRNPLSFLLHAWRNGPIGALRMGLRHGLYCLGCCWLLFLILVPLGVMNIAAMLVVTVVVFAEKALPWGRGVAELAAVALVVYGIAVMAQPALLPTVA